MVATAHDAIFGSLSNILHPLSLEIWLFHLAMLMTGAMVIYFIEVRQWWSPVACFFSGQQAF